MSLFLKQYEYYEFVRWSALPEPLRDPPNQTEFQMKFSVSHDTIARWKNDPNFVEDVRRVLKEWAKDKTPNVVAALYKRILKTGDSKAVQLWMEIFEDQHFVSDQPTIIEIRDADKVLILNAFTNFGLLEEPKNSNEASIPKTSRTNYKQPAVKERSG